MDRSPAPLPSLQEAQFWVEKAARVAKQSALSWFDGVANPSPDAYSAVLAGKVVKVIDGDTLELRLDRTIHIIRLDQIDAPGIGQPWGRRARQALHRRVVGQQVVVEIAGVDRYERLLDDEAAARQARMGLWRSADPIPSWEWRRLDRRI